jgi:Protein of unknown function (DUF4197)
MIVPMKTKMITLIVLGLAAAGVVTHGQNQSVLDLLRSIQPAQAPAGQPAPQPAPAPAAPPPNQTPAPSNPPPALDTKPAFMSIATNYTRITNVVIVTNYVVVTNLIFTTNFYNAQGQLLMPIQLSASRALALAETKPNPSPLAPDPVVIRSNRLQAVREMLFQGLTVASNTLSAEGGFSANPIYQIRIPDGVTSFDRKKSQALTTAMNTAAEKAVPAACAVLQKTIAQLNPPDPVQVIQGGSDAATRYMLSAEGQNVANQVLAIVQGTAADAHVTEAYNAVMLRGGFLGAVLGSAPSVDLNAHITRGLMDAIFLTLSSQENLVRTVPSARKTKALQDAFAK